MITRRRFSGGLGSSVAGIGLGAPFLSGRTLAQAQVTIKGVYSAPGLSFAPIFLAEKTGLWAKNGLQAEFKRVKGGPLAMVALSNREAQFSGVASTDPIIGWAKGIKTLSIAAFTGALDMQFAARKEWMSKTGVGPKSSLADKIRAMKGARIGSSTIGGGPAQYTRYLARSAGLDPERDLKILAVGFGASRMAALRTNQVDITVGSAPEADQVELEGFAAVYLDCANEVPLFKEFLYTVALVTPQFANDQADVVRRVAQTFGQANDLFHTSFGTVVDVMKKLHPKIPAKAMETALERARTSYPRGGRMTAAMWENSIKVAVDTNMISSPISSREGELWTNKFLA